VLIAAVLIQVLGRSVFSNSPVWTEELTRYALLYLAAIGVGLSYKSGDLVNVDVLQNIVPQRVAWIMRLLSTLAVAVFALTLIIPAWDYMSIGAFQTSPALGWRMTYIYVSVLILIVLLAAFSVMRFIGMLAKTDTGIPNPYENEHDEGSVQ